MVRYSIIDNKNPREIVLLRGVGCAWRGCTFCDYHLDSSPKKQENFLLNKTVLDNVTGIYNHLEIINSGSFTELDNDTLNYIVDVCKKSVLKYCILNVIGSIVIKYLICVILSQVWEQF